jgi:hypothetical protein
MNKGLKRGAILLVALAAMGGCSNSISTNSEIEQGPVGIGRGINELKGTPCACTEIPMTFPEQMSA